MITFTCNECGKELESTLLNADPDEDDGVEYAIQPCGHCQDNAQVKGYKDGYDEGYFDGEASVECE